MRCIFEDARQVAGFSEAGPFPLPMRLVDKLEIRVIREITGTIPVGADQAPNMVDETLQNSVTNENKQ